MRESLVRVEKVLGLRPLSVNELTRRSGFTRSTTLRALHELRAEHGLAYETSEGWVHGNAVNGRESREAAFGRMFAPFDELVNATLEQYVAGEAARVRGQPGPLAFTARMLEACAAARAALLERTAP